MKHRRWTLLAAAGLATLTAVACEPDESRLSDEQIAALPETPDDCFVYHGPDVFGACTPTAVGLKMDVYNQPAPGAPAHPVIVYVHGGGWYSGDRTAIDDEFFHVGSAILHQANRDDVEWTVVSIDYSLDAPWPEPLLDVKRAVRMVRGLMGPVQQPVIVAGSSAGGHLATMAALTPGVAGLEPGPGATQIAGAVNLDGPNHLGILWGVADRARTFQSSTPAAAAAVFGESVEFGEMLAHLAGCPGPYDGPTPPWDDPLCQAAVADLVEDASPAEHIDEDDPPIYLVCGEDTAGFAIVFPEDFGCDSDHTDMQAALLAQGSLPAGGLDVTTGNHFSIDRHLDLPELQSFLDGLRGGPAT